MLTKGESIGEHVKLRSNRHIPYGHAITVKSEPDKRNGERVAEVLTAPSLRLEGIFLSNGDISPGVYIVIRSEKLDEGSFSLTVISADKLEKKSDRIENDLINRLQ